LLLRLLALMGGRLPDRAIAVGLFAGAVLVALILTGLAMFERAGPRLSAFLLVAQAALALAFSTGSDPLMTVACTWLWLLLVPVTGLANLRLPASSLAQGLTLLNLAMIPGSIAFVGLWLGGLALDARGLRFAMIPVVLVVILAAIAALSRIALPRSFRLDIGGAWATALLLIAAFPIVAIAPLVVPAAATARLVPFGTISASPFGLTTIAGGFPALVVSLVIALVLGLALWWMRSTASTLPSLEGGGGKGPSEWGRETLAGWGESVSAWVRPMLLPAWSRFVLWGTVAVAVFLVLTRQ
jgi:hypothetical protein